MEAEEERWSMAKRKPKGDRENKKQGKFGPN